MRTRVHEYSDVLDGGRFVGMLDDDTFCVGRNESSAQTHATGSVTADGVVRDLHNREVGYLASDSKVMRGVQYSSTAIGVVDGRMFQPDGDGVRLVADGPEPGLALVAAALLLVEHDPRNGLGGLAGLVLGLTDDMLRATGGPAAPESSADLYDAPPLGPLAPPQGGRPARHLVTGPLTAAGPGGPVGAPPEDPGVQFLPKHARNDRFGGGFRVGQRVRVDTFGMNNADGKILARSTDWEYGQGTKLFPAFLVEFEDGTRGWHSGISFTKQSRGSRWPGKSRGAR